MIAAATRFGAWVPAARGTSERPALGSEPWTAEVLRELAAGDTSHFGDFVLAFDARLRAAARRQMSSFRRVVDLDDIDDVVMMALARIWRRVGEFDPDGEQTATAWVFRQLRAAEQAQRRRAHPRREWHPESEAQEFFVSNLPSHEPIPSAVLEASEDVLRIADAVRALPPPVKSAVTVHYLRETPVELAAPRLGVQPNTLRSRLARGRDLLREMLRDLDEGDRFTPQAGEAHRETIEPMARTLLVMDPRTTSSEVQRHVERHTGLHLSGHWLRVRLLSPLRKELGITARIA